MINLEGKSRIISLVLVALLLLGSAYAIWWAFSIPTETAEQATLVSYQQEGEFDHQVYAQPGTLSTTGGTEVFYTNLIESMDVEFSYNFVPQEPVTQISHEVEISAVLENEGYWRYEDNLVPKTERTGNFTLIFPLEATQFKDVISDIVTELGTISYGSISPYVTLKATVHTVAQTEFGWIEDDFVQSVRVKLTQDIVEWDKDLALWQLGSYQGMQYEHQGIFNYTIKLKPNILFGPLTIKSNTPPPGPPIAMSHSETYSKADIYSMEATFSYQFESDPSPSQVLETIEVTGTLQDPGTWSETLVLVPRTDKSGSISITFPLDLNSLYEIIDAKQQELGVLAASHELVLTAAVDAVAQTDGGPVEEFFHQSFTMSFAPNAVGWADQTTMTRPGSITETTTSANSVWPARGGALAALLLLMPVGAYVTFRYVKNKPIPPNATEAEVRRARRKHKDIIVDVVGLPEAKAEDTIIRLDSFDELIKGADALLKPVLHKAEGQKHTYCVIDGSTRYEYTRQLEELEF